MKAKFCSKCKKEKDITEFCRNKSKKDGLNNWCRECINVYDGKYYKKNKEKYKKNYLNWRKENPKRAWANFLLSNHKRNGYIIDITKDELLEMAKKVEHCPFCNCKLLWVYGNGLNDNTPTLDRINNEKHLTLNNVQILCHKCNAMKQDKTMEELIEWCGLICKKYGGKKQ